MLIFASSTNPPSRETPKVETRWGAEAKGWQEATRLRFFDRLTGKGDAGGHPIGDRNEEQALIVRRETDT